MELGTGLSRSAEFPIEAAAGNAVSFWISRRVDANYMLTLLTFLQLSLSIIHIESEMGTQVIVRVNASMTQK